MAYQLLTYLLTTRLFRFSMCLMFIGIREEGGENEMQGKPYVGGFYATYGACGKESRCLGRKHIRVSQFQQIRILFQIPFLV